MAASSNCTVGSAGGQRRDRAAADDHACDVERGAATPLDAGCSHVLLAMAHERAQQGVGPGGADSCGRQDERAGDGRDSRGSDKQTTGAGVAETAVEGRSAEKLVRMLRREDRRDSALSILGGLATGAERIIVRGRGCGTAPQPYILRLSPISCAGAVGGDEAAGTEPGRTKLGPGLGSGGSLQGGPRRCRLPQPRRPTEYCPSHPPSFASASLFPQ
ncbi:hypothetical protein IMZ48_00120 [Candidatus Bathyarchaeota archaeon]|nr:hypothetical protein [Candidatus Bathyarchaeota archaeon]